MRMPSPLSMLAGLLPWACLWAAQALAQTGPQLQITEQLQSLEDPPSTVPVLPLSTKVAPKLQLKLSSGLTENLTPADKEQLPTYVQSDQVQGRSDLAVQLQGSVVLRRGDTLIRADRLDYDQVNDRVQASGQVHMNRGGTRYQGSYLDLEIDAMSGFVLKPQFQILRGTGHGRAERMDFIDEKRSVAKKATYTTCTRQPGPSWFPAWMMNAEQISFDIDKNEGVAKNAVLRFLGAPILAAPSVSFPLTEERKSGFLPPVFGVDSLGGVEMSLPYYLNLAPNRDLTITATPMTQRGVKFSNEFRYMERPLPLPPFQGTSRLELMPIDDFRDQARWGFSHSHVGWGDMSQPIGFGFTVNRVSDYNYWRDFASTTGDPLAQRILPNSANMTWARGTLTTGVSVLQWQTMQDPDPAASIASPFDRMPQLNANYLRADLPGGFDWNLAGELTRFTVDRSTYCTYNPGSAYCYQPNAARIVVHNQLARPILVPYGYLTPKLMLQARQYQYENNYSGIYGDRRQPSLSEGVAVPTFSLDTGAVLERRTRLFGSNWTQTLEPRAFYVHTLYRDQNDLPNYDTGFNDFNFATVFTENAFSGADRISDSHTFTMGATSRLINPDTGAEGARFGVAQRLRLSDQRVLLTPRDAPVSGTFSDILGGASLYLTPRLSLDSMVQYNQELKLSEKSSLGARFSPTSYRTVTASYRFQRDSSETVDLSWQWPVNDLWADFGVDAQQGKGLGENRWYTLGRLNYSMKEQRLMESLLGFEFDAGCWVARYALTRTQISQDSSTTRLMFQLELNDFSRLGVGALSSVKDNISRYQNLREPLKFTPSRFGQYE